jgi:phage FluMu protein Com
MPQTTQCPKCGVVLNLPDGSGGKKLRCPRCAERFAVKGADEAAKPGARPSTSNPPVRDSQSRPASSLLLSESGLPQSERDLRETFGRDELLGEAEPAAGAKKRRSGPEIPLRTSTDTTGITDAESLLQDDEGVVVKTPRRGGAEARSAARRCPTCQSVVPAGMSLCNRCGLDLDTGKRTQIDELFDVEPVAPRRASTPIGVLLLGGLSMVSALIGMVLALYFAGRVETSQYGYLSLALVGAFGVYAAVEFLRGKTAKLLVVALLIGALVVAVGMIVMPFVSASDLPETVGTGVVIDAFDAETEAIQIESFRDRIQPYKTLIYCGILLLLIDAAALYYMTTPGVRRHFQGR